MFPGRELHLQVASQLRTNLSKNMCVLYRKRDKYILTVHGVGNLFPAFSDHVLVPSFPSEPPGGRISGFPCPWASCWLADGVNQQVVE